MGVIAARPKLSLHDTFGFAVVTPIVMLLVRRVLGDRERRARLAERERDLAAREAVVAERARIARELHDVVAHSVSVMVVQAQAGPRLLAEPQRAGGAFRSIETTGRGALVELRVLLRVLRGGEEHAATASQPGLGSLDALLEQVRKTGLGVDLRIESEPAQLPAGVDLSAYRIVQEALTNTIKHAGRAEAEVIVRYQPAAVEVEILDNGVGPHTRVNDSGHGLVGMRERVALYGGVLEAGGRNGHGFAVRAQLPLGTETAAWIRVLSADDQALVRTGFRVILDAEPDLHVVGEAADGREAIEAALTLHPDVVPMDIRMPNLDGIAATAASPCSSERRES